MNESVCVMGEGGGGVYTLSYDTSAQPVQRVGRVGARL